MVNATASDNSDFKLLRYFSTASLLAFIVVAVLPGYVFRQLAIDGLLSGYENEHVNHAKIIANGEDNSNNAGVMGGLRGVGGSERCTGTLSARSRARCRTAIWWRLMCRATTRSAPRSAACSRSMAMPPSQQLAHF